MTTQQGFLLKSGLQAGSDASDKCWAARNVRSVICEIARWPQHSEAFAYCAGKNSERELKECLSQTYAPNWFEDFPGCTSDKQCYDTRPAYTKP